MNRKEKANKRAGGGTTRHKNKNNIKSLEYLNIAIQDPTPNSSGHFESDEFASSAPLEHMSG